jgi:hypothetical protein
MFMVYSGRFPEVAYEQSEDSNTLLQVSDCIKIIHELGYGREWRFCNSEFEKANEAIIKSEKVAFLGLRFSCGEYSEAPD